MIRELSELGKLLREEKSKTGKLIHNALKDEPISIDLIINANGSFVRFEVIEKILRPAEALTSKKGKARLLLDKAEEVLGYKGDISKHDLFIKKLNEYKNNVDISPVLDFYNKNETGVTLALQSFESQVGEKERGGNIAFRIIDETIRIHEKKSIINDIITRYENYQQKLISPTTKLCSICGKNDFAITDTPHGMIKRVPDGKSSGCALVSYNENAFESYDLDGNMNSSICINCARTYVEGLNWLLSAGPIVKNQKGKEYTEYSNRRNFGKDTAMIFWTRNNSNVDEVLSLDNPTPESVNLLIESVISAKPNTYLDTDKFYSCTLSGADARITVRDWIETSLIEVKRSIIQWFSDIKIERLNFDTGKPELYYSRVYALAHSAHNTKADNDPTISRIAVSLWNAALKGTMLPKWILSSLLKRIRVDGKGVTAERAALIKIILNRNCKGGDMVLEKLDEESQSTAYVCGRIFSVLENIQRSALGKDLNAGIRERFFSSASTNPSSAFGRLLKMSQNHLSKLRGERPGIAIFFDKELQELFTKISSFPVVFTLEEQGQFAIGYYHQKQDSFKRAMQYKELADVIENEDEDKGE